MSDRVGRVVEWLRAGYPAGVPREDCAVLLGLLGRSLTDHEVRTIGAELVDDASAAGTGISTADVERLVERATLDVPSPADVARVSAHLAAGGWPLGDPPG